MRSLLSKTDMSNRDVRLWSPPDVGDGRFNYNVITEHELCANGGRDMQSVKINREKLLEKVKENRENHHAVFERAVVVYKAKVIEELEAMLAVAKEGLRVKRSISLTEPVDMTREYDQVIAMLEMSVDEEIELTNREFAQYVLDRWSWKGQFAASNRQYVEEYNMLPAKFTTEGELPARETYGRALDE